MRQGLLGSLFAQRTILIWVMAAMAGTVVQAQVPDEFTNLKVLPEDIDKRELMSMMRGFTNALDVRCNHCHVGEDPDSLEGYDFASDEKQTKHTARVMIRMVQQINHDILPQTERDNLIQVQCITCHRGLQKPVMLDLLVLAAIEANGLDAATTQYRRLRQDYYGKGAYDFGPAALDGVTETLAMQKGDAQGALAINNLNLEFHPDSDYTLYLHSRLLLQAGDRDGAIATLERAIEANPDVDWLKGQLERVKNPPPQE